MVTFLMGMLWCYIYEKTKNIFITMGIHFLYNTITVVGGMIAERYGEIDVKQIVSGNMQRLLILCLALIIIIVSVCIIRKLMRNNALKKE